MVDKNRIYFNISYNVWDNASYFRCIWIFQIILTCKYCFLIKLLPSITCKERYILNRHAHLNNNSLDGVLKNLQLILYSFLFIFSAFISYDNESAAFMRIIHNFMEHCKEDRNLLICLQKLTYRLDVLISKYPSQCTKRYSFYSLSTLWK